MNPPKWSIAFLEWFCPDELLEGILGDLLEQFDTDQQRVGNRKARRLFAWSVIRLFHPSIILRNHLTVKFINMSMLKSHLLVAIRSMMKYKFYSIINVLGLSFAIAFVFLAFLFIQNEQSYDQFHSKKDAIYRVYHDIRSKETGETKSKSAVTAVPLSKDLANEIPAITQFSRYGSNSCTIKKGEKPFEEVMHFVDPDFVQMFDFPWISGDKNTALDQPNSVILTTEMAKKYFGESNPIGQTLDLTIKDTTLVLEIGGVIDAKKERSSLPFDFLMVMDQFRLVVSESAFTSYRYGLLENYVQLAPNTEKSTIKPLLKKAAEKFYTSEDNNMEYGLQALSSLHFEDEVIGNALYTSPQKLYIMLALAVLVLIIASINFITLSTSHALNRLKEVGVRKTLGALKRQLRRQLILESFFVTLLSGVIGLTIAVFLLPVFSDLIGNSIRFGLGASELGFLLLLTLFIAWITGWLQSLVLVKFKAIEALKGNLTIPRHNRWFNESLVVLQFALSIILIIGAVNIRTQMQYIQHKDLGYDKERLLEVWLGGASDTKTTNQMVERFRNLALQDDQILEVAASMNNTDEPWTELLFDQDDGSKEKIFFNQISSTYLETMDIELLKGADFYKDTKNAANAILVNEALVKHFGWENPLSQQIPGTNFEGSHQIIGVVKDFHFNSLHQKIEPLVLALDASAISSGITGLSTYVWPPNLYQLVVRIGPGELKPPLEHLEKVWGKVNPDKSFNYRFVDEVLDAKYAEEKRWGKVTDWASAFAIVIAWLGLIGMMRLTIQKRTKEVGIRKVLGASVPGVISLLSKRFLLLVLFGSLIAWPIAWILMGKWLESFTYRIDLNPFLFLLIGVGVLVVALSSIGLQALRAALANPVEALRFE